MRPTVYHLLYLPRDSEGEFWVCVRDPFGGDGVTFATEETFINTRDLLMADLDREQALAVMNAARDDPGPMPRGGKFRLERCAAQ